MPEMKLEHALLKAVVVLAVCVAVAVIAPNPTWGAIIAVMLVIVVGAVFGVTEPRRYCARWRRKSRKGPRNGK